MDFSVEIVLRSLATTSIFVEFRDSRNLHVFRDVGCRMTRGKVRGYHMAPQECDT